MEFSPAGWVTGSFVVLTLAVVAANLALLRAAAPIERRGAWSVAGAAVAGVWLVLHAGIAASGLLDAPETLPPPLAVYAVLTLATAVAFAVSRFGRALAGLPLAVLVALQAFRAPLEALLHALHDGGDLPVQMTWSGLNFDVVTGLTAIALGLYGVRGRLPHVVVYAWNAMGLALLVTVVSIAVTSAPTPLRLFTEGPAVVLPLKVPYGWIVSVHVWPALAGHLVVFRALTLARSDALSPPTTEASRSA